MHYDQHLSDIIKFYAMLDELEQKVGGKRILGNCDGRMDWPRRGVYFFFEPGEMRSHSGEGQRVVRIGAHALKKGSKTTLWKRLRQHRGTLTSGGGNHRGSVFRLHVGTALINRDHWTGESTESWSIGSSADKGVRQYERQLEIAVSDYIRKMPLLWLEIDDDPGPDSMRGYVERNTIGLLSNYGAKEYPIDPPSKEWLGFSATSDKINKSGLWDSNHVDEDYDPSLLEKLKVLIE